MVISRTAIFFLFLFALRAQAQTYISGGDVAGTWKTDGNPYIISDNVVISADNRLKIEPGVIVQFEALSAILVYGSLEAYGNENDSIVFTSIDTTGFTSGNYSGWLGLAFLGQGNTLTQPSALHYCNIEFSMGSGLTCIEYDKLNISNSHFRNNQSYGVNLWEFSDINMDFVKISNNGNGGIDIKYSAPNILHFEIATNNGPGISISGITLGNAPVILNNGMVHNNYNTENGGGISIIMEAQVELNNVDIQSNSALNGGGMYCTYSIIRASNLSISNNTAENGAGIYGAYDAQIETDHILLNDNSASQSGGAVYVLDSKFDMLLSTISNNTAAISGGGFYFDLINNNTPNHLSSCILWQNYPDEIIANANVPELDFCDVMGGFAGTNNIDEDPLFEDVDKGNYHLSWNGYPFENEEKSPCIDAGNPHLGYDQDETVVDMGAFYYHQSGTVTAVETKQAETNYTLYPNPVSSSFSIKGMDDLEKITVCNLSGQVVKEFQAVNPQSYFNISDLQAGIYVVRMHCTSGNIESQKIIRK